MGDDQGFEHMNHNVAVMRHIQCRSRRELTFHEGPGCVLALQ